MANDIKWNGMLLGGAFGGLLGFFIQSKATAFWSTIGGLSDKIIASWSGFSSISTDFMSYAIFIIVGLIIGLIVEYN